MRRAYVYANALGQWFYEVWYGTRLAVIGSAATKERAEFEAALA